MDENAKGMSSLGDALLRIYEIERGLWGDLISTMLMRTILQGVLEHRPYDSTGDLRGVINKAAGQIYAVAG